MQGIRSSSEPYALLKARTAREKLGTTWGLSETAPRGPRATATATRAGTRASRWPGPWSADHRGDGRRGSRGNMWRSRARPSSFSRNVWPRVRPAADRVRIVVRDHTPHPALSPEGRGMGRRILEANHHGCRENSKSTGASRSWTASPSQGRRLREDRGRPSFRHRPVTARQRAHRRSGLAPRNAQGLVESSADFYLLRPTGGGNRRLFLDVPKPRRKVALGMFNSTPRSTTPPRARTSATAS